jgi:hypothetical protein
MSARDLPQEIQFFLSELVALIFFSTTMLKRRPGPGTPLALSMSVFYLIGRGDQPALTEMKINSGLVREIARVTGYDPGHLLAVIVTDIV